MATLTLTLKFRNYFLSRLFFPSTLGMLGVKVVFSGHQHQNDGGFYKGLEQVVTSAMGWQQRATDTPGIRIVKVKEEGITHQYYEMDDIPTTIDLKE